MIIKTYIKQLFLNHRFILFLVFLNAIIIFIQEWTINENPILSFIDQIITLLFVLECCIKIKYFGFKSYFSDAWNKLDFFLTVISLPSLLTFFVPQMSNFSVILALRILRVFKFFRIIKYFPNVGKLAQGIRLAFRDSFPVLLGYLVLIVISALLSCSMFQLSCPEYFCDPVRSIYTIFQLFTVEGWYEIPNAVAVATQSEIIGALVKIYFSILLIIGGIFGMSIVNSVFVDSMVADNNDEIERKIDQLNYKIDELRKKLENNQSFNN